MHHAVYGYFQNGGGACYIVRIGGNGAVPPTAKAELTATTGGTAGGAAANVGAFRVQALAEGADGNDISVEIADATAEGAAEDAFKLVVRRGGVEETFDNVTSKKGRQNVVSRRQRPVEAGPPRRPRGVGGTGESRHRQLSGGGVPAPSHLAPDDYVGDPSDRTGFGGLEAIDEITMVSVPDLMSAYQTGLIDQEGVQAVQLAMIAHCELMGDRIAVLDPPPGLNAQQIKEWRVDKAGYDSKYAALYWPWVKVMDPASGTNIFVPPSGHMAGIWGRNDDTRGVHKAPANEVVRGAITLEINITKNEHDLLNPVGINCIRAFPGRGIRVWGARTLSSDPAWRYLNVRRLFNYLEKSILNGTDWVVFEPNDYALWSKISRTISTFLVNEWRKGALFGLDPGRGLLRQV